MHAYCTSCGSELQRGWQHCAACGAEIRSETARDANAPAYEIEGVQPPSKFKRHRRVILIAAGIFIAAVALFGADWYRSNQEVSGLLSTEKGASRPVVRYSDRVASCTSAACHDEPAARALAGVSYRRQRIEEVSVLPWHTSARRCREHLVDFYEAWESYLRWVAGPSTSGEGSALGADIKSSYRSAQSACEDAIPMFALFDLSDRLDHQF